MWDRLLLADSTFPLFLGLSSSSSLTVSGLAILRQLRPLLVSASFNEAILVFSNLRHLNVDVLLADAQRLHGRVPRSCCYRRFLRSSPENFSEADFSAPGFETTHLPLEEQRQFLCPRISAMEFLKFLHHAEILVVDVRPQLESVLPLRKAQVQP